MLTKRVIACLDVKDGRVVKGVQFRNHIDMGDILDLSQRYTDEGVDELVFYDIAASSDGRTVNKSWVNQIARRINIPFCVAGGRSSWSVQSDVRVRSFMPMAGRSIWTAPISMRWSGSPGSAISAPMSAT